MAAIICALLSGVAFHLSTNLGEIWPLAWVAATPVLWLSFGDTKTWQVAVASFAAYAIGTTNLLPVYAGLLPWPVLVLALTLPSAIFAAIVLGTRLVARRTTPLLGALAFAVFMTTFDYLASLGENGTALSPAHSQVGAPLLIQGASLFGLWFVTFLISLIAALLALALRQRSLVPFALAVAVFAGNAALGWTRMRETSTDVPRVALIGDDRLSRGGFADEKEAALAVMKRYAAEVEAAARQKPELIVLPEKIAIVRPAWKDEARETFANAARAAHARLVVGLDDRGPPHFNIAWIFSGTGSEPLTYQKRRLVPGLESPATLVGPKHPMILTDRLSFEICKDMDFPDMIRGDANGVVTMAAVPAWDFGGDRWWHARLAIMRGVENGFSVARSARDGLLTLSDAYGRPTAWEATKSSGPVTVVGELPRGPGSTLYSRIGNAFAWAAIAASLALLALSLLRRR